MSKTIIALSGNRGSGKSYASKFLTSYPGVRAITLSGSHAHKKAAYAFAKTFLPSVQEEDFVQADRKDTPLYLLYPADTDSSFTPRDLINGLGAGLVDLVDSQDRTWPVLRDRAVIEQFLRDTDHNLLICDDARVPRQIDNFPASTLFIRLEGGVPQSNYWDTAWKTRERLFTKVTPDFDDPSFVWLRRVLKTKGCSLFD